MDILFYKQDDDDVQDWIEDLVRALPAAQVRAWKEGDLAPADYALVWKPNAAVLAGRQRLKAVFNLGAGVDALIGILKTYPDLVARDVPMIRLDDAGMAHQMVQYVLHAVLREFRRFDDYASFQRAGKWQPLSAPDAQEYHIGVMGLGALGTPVARALTQCGFPVRGWSRSPRDVNGVEVHAGMAALPGFLAGLKVLVNILPLTADTENLLSRDVFARLAPGAHLINVARGAHLVDEDLLQALDSGQMARATLDVFRQEPLPAHHPFWRDPRIDMTPHISAQTMRNESVRQIVQKITRLEQGLPVSGVIDLARGY